MNMVELIEKKKNKLALTKEEIGQWIDDYCHNLIPDYQVSALLMAIVLNGMTDDEIFNLTEAMLHSGKVLDLSKIVGVKCDKHSTGGVGDKTSLALCPMVASLGVKVAKMSGRGLGFTGGTLDKLESIPGMQVILTPEQFINNVNEIGMAIIGQSDELVIADKKLYALRDVTGTVDSIPLIASSIMSKKLAAGSDCILLDVKYGNGAFMHTKDDAIKLAKTMVRIGEHFGKDVRAEITSMNQPLGYAIGNILEVKEAVNTLRGNGPKDFVELCLSSGATMLLQAGICTTREEAIKKLQDSIDSGKALATFRQFVIAQGGDISYIDDLNKFPQAMYVHEVKSMKAGYISHIDTMALGMISMRLGAGREKKSDIIDPTAGIVLCKKLGDKVAKGDVLLTMYTEHPNTSELLSESLNAFDFSNEEITAPKVVESLVSYDKNNKDFMIVEE